MSRRSQIPAPYQRLLPSVIRVLGPRVLVAASGVALLLVLGGSSYVLSRITQATPAVPSPNTPHASLAATNAKVLGAATQQPTPASSTASRSDGSEPQNSPSRSTSPACTANCISAPTAPATIQPSFDIAVDGSGVKKGLGTLYVPFTVVRHGGLAAPVTIGSVSVTTGSSITGLESVQSEAMFDADHGAVTVLTLGLPRDVTIHISAQSGAYAARTSYEYQLN